MTATEHIRRVESALLSSTKLKQTGVSPGARRALLHGGTLVRVTHGWVVSSAVWDTWHPADRHLAAVIAAHRNAVDPPLFSHHSAAVLLGIPLWGLRHEPVHTVSRSCAGHKGGMQRHPLEIPDSDTGSVAGIRCTNYDRTLLDLARLADDAMLVGAADAVLRRHAQGDLRSHHGRSWDPAAVDSWRRGMRERVAAAPGMRGIRGLRRMIEFADPRADSPLESVSRLHLTRLGLDVDLQLRVPKRGGGSYYVDFDLLGLGILGEADGADKYTNPELLDGSTPAQALLREKQRDNWISGSTGKRMIHWGARDCRSPEAFAAMLRSFHVPFGGR